MRQRKNITGYVSAIVCLLVAGYFGVQFWNYYTNPFSTMVIYQYQADESVSVSGYLVRDEVVLASQDTGVLQYTRGEGERVSVGGEVVRVYASQETLDNQAQQGALQALSEQMTYAQGAETNPEITMQLDQQISLNLLSYCQGIASEEVDEATSQGQALRSLVLTQSFSQMDATSLSELSSVVDSDLSTASRSISSATKIITASKSGIYSAVVDGYEGVLTPDTVGDWTPSTLNAVTADETVSSNVGKVILGDIWYYVVNVEESVAAEIDTRNTVELAFTKSFDITVTMDVESVSQAEEGQCTVVLSSDRYMGDLTLLRKQSATLVFDTLEGYRVPSGALRVNEEGQTGIYCLVGIRARFKAVDVVYEGSDFMLVEPATTLSSQQLQDGELVIIAANDLYDGKVIE
ncbi:HlyD family efflux transporter periplasmic adaptor subunit [Bengtsoniella intestinalis]|uniref:HlyD family efflux transporter periplasmic adaptor subunit n=1 Tax=Bengtsoniella intestinalis TaxID=3073143 RepID=UPI00391FAE65